jgi:hypothetical protein
VQEEVDTGVDDEDDENRHQTTLDDEGDRPSSPDIPVPWQYYHETIPPHVNPLKLVLLVLSPQQPLT